MTTQSPQDRAEEERFGMDRFFERQRREIMAQVVAEKRRRTERWGAMGLLAASLVVGALVLTVLTRPHGAGPENHASWLNEMSVISDDSAADPLSAFGSWTIAATEGGPTIQLPGPASETTLALPPIFTQDRFLEGLVEFSEDSMDLESTTGETGLRWFDELLTEPQPALESRNQG